MPDDLGREPVTIVGDALHPPILPQKSRVAVCLRDNADGMGIVAKRLEHVPHSNPTKVIIKSLNPEYQTYERNAEEVNIIGRVVWTSKRL